jgi:fermentation-respiration switch protein FrsA (DUF1100 family)
MPTQTLRRYLLGEISLRRLTRSLLLIYACIALFAWFRSDRMIFLPQTPTYDTTEWTFQIPTADGAAITAVHLTTTNATHTVLYNHANAVDLGNIHFFLNRYRDAGFSVMSYDYPGYGTSPGRPTSAHACHAADTAMRYLTETCGIAPDRIIVHGRSVGGGPAVYLAAKHPVAGLIAESTFVSAFRVITHIPILPFDKFRNLARIDQIDCPLLVIHGTDDRTIPIWHGEALYARAKPPKKHCWLPNTTHNEISPEAEAIYWKTIQSFAKTITQSENR